MSFHRNGPVQSSGRSARSGRLDPSGVIVDPSEITQPGGPYDAGHRLETDGAGGWIIVPPVFSDVSVLRGKLTLPALPALGAVSVDVRVKGAALGAHVLSMSALTAALDGFIQSRVIAADTIRVVCHNPGPDALAARTVDVEWILAETPKE